MWGVMSGHESGANTGVAGRLGLSARVAAMPTNQIADIADLAREDPSVIRLWIGEGDLPTPDFIRVAAEQAMQAGQTRYTYAHGLPALRRALADYHARHWGVAVDPGRFSVTAGGVQAMMQAFQAILEPGDEVIAPVPTWPNLDAIVRINHGKMVPVPFRVNDGCFSLDLDDLVAAIGPRTRAIAINSPSNPTGWVMPREQMAELVRIARARGLWIFSDEVYGLFVDGDRPAPSFLEVTEPDDRLLVTNTFSKNWCMTGWRAGWVIFPDGMSRVFENLSQYNTTGVATFIQQAAISALNEGDPGVRALVARTMAARDVLLDALAGIPEITVVKPEGGFYLFFGVRGMNDAFSTAVRILREAGVGLAPGSAFGPGGSGYLRLCFAIDPALAAEAARRLDAFFAGTRET